jgi:diguanylate cyclase (GGDEF)-like protein/PAS domain S-box-containing protein
MSLSHRKTFLALIMLMALIAIAVAGITLVVLYNAAYQEQAKRLTDIAQSKARLLEAFATYNLQQLSKSAAFAATIEQVRDAHKNLPGFGRTGEFVLAQRTDGQIRFLLNSRHDGFAQSKPLPIDSAYAEPIRRALSGQAGVIKGPDYRGEEVLAAYEPVGVFNLGIVAKIDVTEFEAPFIRAGLIAAGAGLILIILGTLVFLKISSPVISSAEKSESQLKTILNTVVDGIITIDNTGTIIAFNASAELMFGYRQDEVLGENIGLLMPGNMAKVHGDYLKNYRKTEAPTIIGISREVLGRRKDGSTFPIDIAVGEANFGGQTVFTGIVRDITERRQNEKELKRYREELEQKVGQRTAELAEANRKLQQLAREDPLTGAANRRVFDETIIRELRRATREQKPLSLIISDIDYFKNYNDTYGHVAGDTCLQKVTQILQGSFQRAGELVARYGGEEFAILLPAVEQQSAVAQAEHLRQLIWQQHITHSSSHIAKRLTLSLGVATMNPGQRCSAQQLIDAADQALYRAKNSGRNCVKTQHTECENLAAS